MIQFSARRAIPILVALLHAGCIIDIGIVAPTPVYVSSSRGEFLTIGTPFSAFIAGGDPTCVLDQRSYPCRQFRVVPSFSGVLRVRARWDGPSGGLALVVLNQPAFGSSPLVRDCRVVGGRTYDVSVLMLERSNAGFGIFDPLRFELVASLD